MLYIFIFNIFQIYLYVYTHTYTYIVRQRENLIKPDIYFIAFNLQNNKVKIKVIKNNSY